MPDLAGFRPEDAEPLGREDILAALQELADRLPAAGPQHLVVIVGAAVLALNGLRETTFDVDSVTALDRELTEAAAEIAAERGIRRDWLNAGPVSFLPATFDVTECSEVFQSGRLRVLAAPFRIIFVMKMLRGERQDKRDLAALWPLCGYSSAQEAVGEFWAAYPSEPEDPYLVNWVAEVQARAERR